MRTADVNGISINYQLEGDGPETVVLVNGLADDLESWGYQTPDLLEAGFRVLTLRQPRASASPTSRPGPYTTELFAERHEGAGRQPRALRLPPGRRLDGRHDRPGVRDRLPGRPALADAGLHVRGAGAVLLAHVRAVGRHGPGDGRAVVMQDVTLWAFTQEFFETRAGRAEGVRGGDGDAHACRSTRTSRSSRRSRPTTRPPASARSRVPTTGDRGRGGHPDPRRALAAAARGHRRARTGRPCRGGHACVWEHPDALQRRP